MSKPSRFSAFKFGQDSWDPTYRFETSWLFTPWVLFSIRAFISLYAFFVLFFEIGWDARYDIEPVNKSFTYFTVLSYWGVACYFAVAATHTASYAINGNRPFLNRFPRPLQALHHFYSSTVTTLPLLVTIVFWGVLYGPNVIVGRYGWWSNISQHGLNSAFALFEIIFTRINPAPWIHMLFMALIVGLYCCLAYIIWAVDHYFVYAFLDFRERYTYKDAKGHKHVGHGNGVGVTVGYIFGIGLGTCLIFAVVVGLVALRKWLTEKKAGMEGKFHGGKVPAADHIDMVSGDASGDVEAKRMEHSEMSTS